MCSSVKLRLLLTLYPDILHIHRQSAYLLGRDPLVSVESTLHTRATHPFNPRTQVVDIPLDHPSCSKQHAAIQYRSTSVSDEYGARTVVVKPFIIDLESVNGTFVNGDQIPASRYYELKASDSASFMLIWGKS